MTSNDHQAGHQPPHDGAASKIRHTHGGVSSAKPATISSEQEPLPVANAPGAGLGSSKITVFGKDRRHEEQWSRTPNATGVGAIHVKTFNCKLTDDALAYMDQAINEWLDAHPQYEVKFVTSTVGVLTGKLKEPHLICQVWV